MTATQVAAVAACVAGVSVRNLYEAFKSAGRVDPRSPRVFAVVFAGMVAMLMSWPLLGWLGARAVGLPAVVRLAGLGAVAAGLGLALGGLWQLRGLENIDHLVTTGLYARLRHPMYTGFIAWILGWALCSGAPVSLALGVVCVGSVLAWRRLEERALEAQFGDAYGKYRETTWF